MCAYTPYNQKLLMLIKVSGI